jgi:hypothetical protein
MLDFNNFIAAGTSADKFILTDGELENLLDVYDCMISFFEVRGDKYYLINNVLIRERATVRKYINERK